ncbi:MAG: tyrosine--tRNA ligase [Candidatus Gribaldobacteria bacterium]|nr:tyrosine--tRNA ligase [Candidatus Gribaldobacteria bacterium]
MKIDTDPNKIKEILERGVEEVINRGHLEVALLSGKQLRVKFGIDPTGPKIHIGRAILLWKLKAFQELGHQIVLIIGDFTGQIGDASDKDSMRKSLSEKEVKENMKDYERQIGKILDMKKVEVRHNNKWLGKLTYAEYSYFAKKFTAQQMIQRRNFKERWDRENPIGLHELDYPLLQGYDSVAVKADVELGGFDQLFNLQRGRDMQKIFKQDPQDILITKMLNGLDGRKMSTSWGNVITIIDEPDDMFGKIMSMQDELIGDYFELCTRLPLAEIAKIKQETANPRDQKARLAKEITALYHGEKAATKAEEEFNKIFQKKELPSEIPQWQAKKGEYNILDLLFESGLTPSKAEAKRMVLGGAVEMNSQTKTDWQEIIKIENDITIQVGKRKFIKILCQSF